jgi:hypothetical protein
VQRKTYTENSGSLNFKVYSSSLNIVDGLGENLNFKIGNIFKFEVSQGLNFNINDFDGIYILFKVLVDFIENYSFGDVFLILPLVDLIVKQYG